jgi:hypothetical protein
MTYGTMARIAAQGLVAASRQASPDPDKGDPMQILENYDDWLVAFRDGWLAHYQRTGEVDWSLYVRPYNRTAPAGPGVDLARSRLMLITTSGAYLPDQQQPFDADNALGDYSIRLWSSSTPLQALAYAHEHYDQAAVRADPQVLLPLEHLQELVGEGAIGELAPSVVSFMGYQPDVARVVDQMVPEIVAAAQVEEVQAALLIPA